MARFTLTGKDAALIEAIARDACFFNKGNCYTPQCKSAAQCGIHGWSDYVGEAEATLRTIRKTHDIVPRGRK